MSKSTPKRTDLEEELRSEAQELIRLDEATAKARAEARVARDGVDCINLDPAPVAESPAAPEAGHEADEPRTPGETGARPTLGLPTATGRTERPAAVVGSDDVPSASSGQPAGRTDPAGSRLANRSTGTLVRLEVRIPEHLYALAPARLQGSVMVTYADDEPRVHCRLMGDDAGEIGEELALRLPHGREYLIFRNDGSEPERRTVP